jgi:Toprim domain
MEATMIDLRSIARALGGEVSGRQVLAPGPGHSPADRSLSVKFDSNGPGGFVVHSFANDDPLACRDHVRRLLGWPQWEPSEEQDRRVHHPLCIKEIDHEDEPRARTEDDLVRIAIATRLWEQGCEPRGTVAEKYLAARSLDLPSELCGSVFRFHPRTPWRNENTGITERIPTLLAAFHNVDDNTITGVHRIRLDQPERWPKAERRMLGIVHRAAIMIDPIKDSTLTIGEGAETCLAARQLRLSPTIWALGSVGAISFFPVIAGVKRLMILAETGKASEEAVQLCGRRWNRAGRRVRIAYPQIGDDFNDAIMGQAL